MKQNILAKLSKVIFLIFLVSSVNVFSQTTETIKKDTKCTKEMMKAHKCDKEMKETTKTEETKDQTKCSGEGEEGNLKVKEIGLFHTPVAELWHKDFPAFNLKKMIKDTEKMSNLLPKLENAKMPKDFAKANEYKKGVADLKNSVTSLKTYLSSLKTATKEDIELKSKVEKLHSDFHNLSGLFE